MEKLNLHSAQYDISAVLAGRPVHFLKKREGKMARGWNTSDIEKLLLDQGCDVVSTEVGSFDRLNSVVQMNINDVFWPACYTVESDGDELCIAAALEDLNATFAGCSKSALSFSSKLRFKKEMSKYLDDITPKYRLLTAGSIAKELPQSLQYPILVKTEFSCNSEGVRLAKDDDQLAEASDELIGLYGQNLYLESWERSREFTVSVISEETFLLSAIELCCLNDAEYIDIQTKADNSLVKLCKVDALTKEKLIDAAVRVCRALQIDGYCRLDMLMNDRGEIHVIEANFQPFMSLDKEDVSYFPAAFKIDSDIEPAVLVSKILAAAIRKTQRKRSDERYA